MEPILFVTGAWLLFAGSHLLLSGTTLRGRIVERFGTRGFTILFGMTSVLTLALVIAAVWIYGGSGVRGPNLGEFIVARWGLFAVSVGGAVILMAGLINFPASLIARLAQRGDRPLTNTRKVNSIERLTRHPFFVGLALLMSAHALLATTLAQTAYFTGFVILALAGIPLQDRKLRRRYKEVYEAYERDTPAVPFGKVEEKTKPNAAWKKWVLAVVVATVFFGLLHPIWSYANGALFALVTLVFGSIGIVVGLVRSKPNVKPPLAHRAHRKKKMRTPTI